MGTLTINGHKVTVDDSFAKLSPADQERTVNEIAAQLPAAQPNPAIRAGQDIAYAGQYDNQAPAPNLLDSTLATINGLTGSVPGLQQASDALLAGGQTIGDIFANRPGTLSQHYADIQKQREAVANKAPVANALGDLAGTIGTVSALPARAGAGLLARGAESALGMAGYEGARSLAHGKGGGDALAAMAGGAAGGFAAPYIGAGVEKLGGAVADTLTRGAQRKLTAAAIEKGAPSARELKDAGAALFESATGGNSPAISGTALDRFMGNVQKSLEKFRPNSANDPQSVGLLQHLSELVKAAKTPGVVVDLKDLHLARQLAQKVGQSSEGRDSTIGNIVAGKIDEFAKSLKPADILGGADPRQAANDLMRGISTWSRAQKVSLIENAIKKAETYKSGYENGLKLSFLNLMKTPDFARLTPVEQAAVREVAKGTTRQNIAEGLGKLGFSLGGSASHNILGGTAGTGILTTALAPVLGPAAFPVALGTTTVAGAAGRRMAEHLADSGAKRAAQIVATPGIPVARQLPNVLAPARLPIELLVRGGTAGALANSR